MFRANDNVNEVVFLTSMLAGVAVLIVSMVTARLNWRPDIPPYSLRTRSLDVLLHPVKYVLPGVLPTIRTLSVLGLVLLTVAVAALVRQGLAQSWH